MKNREELVKDLFGEVGLEKLRAILASVESAAKAAGGDAALGDAALGDAGGAFLLRIDLGHCVYGLVRMATNKKARLSRRQKEIAELVMTGLARREIASQLKISPRTVDTHIERLFVKYGVGTRIELAHCIALLS